VPARRVLDQAHSDAYGFLNLVSFISNKQPVHMQKRGQSRLAVAMRERPRP